MVVIKGVHTYQNNASKEYSDLDVMQMLGRAGRPQFGFLSFLFSFIRLTMLVRHKRNCCYNVRSSTGVEV